MLTAAGLAQALGGRREGTTWMARCPAHADRTPSLAIRDGNGTVLVHCHAGCTNEVVVAALKARGLWQTYEPIQKSRSGSRARNLDTPTATPSGTYGYPVLPKFAKKYGTSGRGAPKHWIRPAKTENQTQYERKENARDINHSPQVAENTPTYENNKNLDRAIDIWCEARDPRGTPAEAYLRSRELELPDEPARVLRYHPRCPWPKGPPQHCLVALFTDIVTDEPRAIHRIAFDPETFDGQGKAMLGPVGGCAVKLSSDEDVTHGLAIAEGIETALAIWCWGWRPIWALGSAGAIERFPVLAGIEALTIMADNDESGTGLRVAKACQDRWFQVGAEAKVLMPRGKGCDWADEWGKP